MPCCGLLRVLGLSWVGACTSPSCSPSEPHPSPVMLETALLSSGAGLELAASCWASGSRPTALWRRRPLAVSLRGLQMTPAWQAGLPQGCQTVHPHQPALTQEARGWPRMLAALSQDPGHLPALRLGPLPRLPGASQKGGR